MRTHKLGTSGLEVPIIALGTMNWGAQNTEEEAHAQLDYAVEERGLKFIDTAEAYPIPPSPELQGLTETYIGNWLKKRGKRDDLIIASKVSPADFVRTRDIRGKPTLDRQSIRDAIQGTLERLQTDYIDLYQVHWPERQTNFFGTRGYEHNPEDESTSIEETLTALGELVDEGLVRFIGVSNETPWGVSEYLRLSREKNLPRIVSNQTQYSLTNRTYEIGLAEQAIREQVPLLAYSCLNGGVLTGKYLDGKQPEGARFTITDRNSGRYKSVNTDAAVKKYVQIATSRGLDPAQMALAFVNSRPFLGSTIIGATSVEQLKSCIDSAELELSDEVMEAIEQVYDEHPDPTC